MEMEVNSPEVPLAASELADWLDRQGADVWWSVDGDWLLNGRVSFPNTGDTLAAEIRRIDKPLILYVDVEDVVLPPKVTADNLGDLAYIDQLRQDRVFRLRWASSPPADHWLLLEDKESAELYKAALTDEGD